MLAWAWRGSNCLSNGDGVIAHRHVAIPAAGRQKQGENVKRLPVWKHGTELGMQPLQFGRAHLTHVVLQRRDVASTVGTARAGLPAFANIENTADDRADLRAVTVVQPSSGPTSRTCAATRAVAMQLLLYKILLDRVHDRLGLGKAKANVARCRRLGSMQPKDFDPPWRIVVAGIKLKYECAAHLASSVAMYSPTAYRASTDASHLF